MTQIRLLPIVVVAASALLVLKTFGLATGGGYTLGGATAVLAAGHGAAPTAETEAVVEPEAPAAPEADPVLDPVDAAAEALFDAVPSGADAGMDAPEMREVTGTGGTEIVTGEGGSTEAVLLERLAERRTELDAFAAELETRLAVVEAAELRIEERMAELDALEASINAAVDAEEAADAEQFATIVAMYENMRPGDAATIFNDLETSVLVRVSKLMNPRKLGPIMAEMVTAKAQQLTVLLARTDAPAAVQPAPQDVSELPQIIGQ